MAICACIKEIYIEVESWLCGLEAPAQRMERPLVEGSLEQAGPTLMQSSSEIRCAQCTGPLPAGTTRFGSAACLAQFKREQERGTYGHRHQYRCVECGHVLRLGRHRKELPLRVASPVQPCR